MSGSQVSILTAKSNHLANLNKYNQKKKSQLMQIQTAGLIHERCVKVNLGYTSNTLRNKTQKLGLILVNLKQA